MATGGGYRRSFSPRVLRMSKKVFCAASFTIPIVLHRAVSRPSKSEICQVRKKPMMMMINVCINYVLEGRVRKKRLSKTHGVAVELQGVGEFIRYNKTWL